MKRHTLKKRNPETSVMVEHFRNNFRWDIHIGNRLFSASRYTKIGYLNGNLLTENPQIMENPRWRCDLILIHTIPTTPETGDNLQANLKMPSKSGPNWPNWH